MSLDVYLEMPVTNQTVEMKIYIRRDGSNIEITRDEWDALYPGLEPLVVDSETDKHEVFWANTTHNLGTMADAAGIYQVLWRPDEVGISKANQLIDSLRSGLKRLKDSPDEFRKYNPSNGWGTYDGLVKFVGDYLAACIEYPDAEVEVSR